MTLAAPDALIAPPSAPVRPGWPSGPSGDGAQARPWLLAVVALGLALAVALTVLAMVTAHRAASPGPVRIAPAAVGSPQPAGAPGTLPPRPAGS